MKKMKKMKKIISMLVCVTMLVSVLASCGQKKSEDSDGKVTISVNRWPMESDPNGLAVHNSYKAKLNELYPNINLETDTGGYAVDKFFIDAASGQLTNLYYAPLTEAGKIIDGGFAKDITKWIVEYGYDKGVNPDIMKLVTRDGKYYGIPYAGYNISLMYNMNLMREAGLVEADGSPMIADTYDELTEMAVTIKEKTGKSGFFISTKGTEGGWQFMNLAWSYGVDFMEQVDGKWVATFDSDEAVAAMQCLKDWKWKYDILPANNLVNRDDMIKMFAADEVAMAYHTPDMAQKPVLNYGMNKDDIGGSAIPAGPAGRYSQMGGNLWFISNETTDEQVDALFKWLEVKGDTPKFNDSVKESLEEKLVGEKDKGVLVIPPAVPVWTSEERVTGENALYEKYMNYNPTLWPMLNPPEDLMLREEEPMYGQELYSALSDVMQRMLTDENADPRAELEKANAAFQKDYLDKAN